MTFDLEKAREVADFMQAHRHYGGDRFAEALAEIERLRAEMDNYGDDFVCQMKCKDARIKALEEALVEERAANLFNGTWDHNLPGEPDYEEVMGRAREEARAEIFTDAIPRSWQITDERKDAIRALAFYLERHDFQYDIYHPHRHGCYDWIDMLRAMLQEAEQE